MFFNDYDITEYEVDNKILKYDDLLIISFSEIESEIRKRTKKLHISVVGEYQPKYHIDPFVYLQVSYEGYHLRIVLEKYILKENSSKYYDYLADRIVNQFGYYFFTGKVLGYE